MRYLQVIASLACVLLVVIVWQLHGMRPVRYGDIESTMKAKGNDAAFEKIRNAPVVRIVE
jgi:hypothetical protein